MKASVRIGLIVDDYEGDAYDVIKTVSGLYDDETDEEVTVVSVEMTPEEQREAFEFLVSHIED